MRHLTPWLTAILLPCLLTACGKALPAATAAFDGDLEAMKASTGSIADQLRKNAVQPTAFGLLSKSLPVPGKALPVTYLTYEALDNNLEGDLLPILNKLEAIGSSDRLNLIAHTDGHAEKDTRRYYLMKLPETKEGVASPYVDLPELNSAAPRTLEATVRWGFTTYPAKTRWLNLSSHGGAWLGALQDSTSKAWMDLVPLAGAVRAGARTKLDLLTFDACMMASLEVAFELRDTASCMVGSEDSTTYWGRGYYETITKVATNPEMAPKAIAADLVETVHDRHGGTVYQSATVTAFDLTKADDAARAIDQLAGVLVRKAGPYRARLKDAVRGLKPFMSNSKKDNEGLDIQDLGQLLNAFSTAGDAELRQAVGACRQAVFAKSGMLLATRNSHYENHATTGLSIYMPIKGYDHTYDATALAKATRWDEFLIELNR